MLGRLLRTESGLRAGGVSDAVLATYHHENGSRPFAFRRDGLVIDPEGAARFVPFIDIRDTSLHARELLRADKQARQDGAPLDAALPLRLTDGAILVLPLNQHPEGMSERLTIAGLIEQRVTIARSKARRVQEKAPSAPGEGG